MPRLAAPERAFETDAVPAWLSRALVRAAISRVDQLAAAEPAKDDRQVLTYAALAEVANK